MTELFNVIMQHPRAVIELLAGYWLFNALVSGMPTPDPVATDFRKSALYQWGFTSAHSLSGSVKTAINDPRLQTIINNNNTNVTREK